jgi:hypothetical protein
VDFIVRSAFGGTGSFVVPVISLWSQTVRADQDVTASRRCGSRWRGRAEQLVWTYPPPSARPKMSAGADTDNGKETAMEPYCSTRRGESRCTAAPLTLTPRLCTPLTLTPMPLYAVRRTTARAMRQRSPAPTTHLPVDSLRVCTTALPAARAHHAPHGDRRDTWRRLAVRATAWPPGSGLSPSASPTTGNTVRSSGTC